MTTPVSLLPLSAEQLARLQSATGDFSPAQLAWLSGYFWGVAQGNGAQSGAVSAVSLPVSAAAPAPAQSITLISASQTGNARRVAEQLRDDLLAAKLAVTLVNAGDYKFKQIAQETLLLVVISTQGEGEPPEEAVALHKFLFSKKAPALTTTSFAVFGLGDTSCEFFCKAGKDVDGRLAELGSESLLDRVDADVDYQAAAEQWRRQIVDILQARVPAQGAAVVQASAGGTRDEISSSPYSKTAPLHGKFLR